ncbi:MAG: NlpC/P60 family protein, partial [Shewanella sp.]
MTSKEKLATDPRVKQALKAQTDILGLQEQKQQLEAQLAESASQMNQQLRDAFKSVDDFYRGIARQAQELALTVKDNNAEIALINTRTKIKQAMQGFHNTFIDQFMNQVVEILQTSTDQTKLMIDAQRQVMGIQNSLTDQLLQAQQQANSLPGIGAMPGVVPAGGITASAKNLADVAMSRAGKEFAPGLAEQCANFVRDVLAQAGVKIGTTQNAWDGYEKAPNAALAASFFGDDIGTRINNKKDVLPGDIVAFGGTYGGYDSKTITHVGIATGNNMMVDRSTSGKAVTHRSLDTFDGTNNGKGTFLYAVRPHALGQGAAPAMSQQMGTQGGANGVNSQFFGIRNQADMYRMAVVAITEGLANNIQSQIDSAVSIGNRVQLGIGGNNASAVVSAPGQYEAYTRFGLQGVGDRSSAVAALNRNGYNGEATLNQFMAALSNSAMVANSIGHLKGSTDYRAFVPGVTLAARPGDPQRSSNDNYYIPGGDSHASISAAQAASVYQKGRQMIGSGGGQVMAPTTGMAQGQVQNYDAMLAAQNAMQSKLTQGTALSRQNAEQQIASTLQLAE